MTENEINWAVAEDQGWHHFIDDEWGPLRALRPDQAFKESCIFTELNFTTSLDAIRAAAMGRFGGDLEGAGFGAELLKIATTRKYKSAYDFWQLTPLDWCEAYLRAAGKWKES